jgi:hypothetical protein
MSEQELAQALMNVLDAVEAYDQEQPVQTRLSRKHYAMALAILKARESLAVWRDHRARMLDGERAPEYTIYYPTPSVCPQCGATMPYHNIGCTVLRDITIKETA